LPPILCYKKVKRKSNLCKMRRPPRPNIPGILAELQDGGS
jgi:hypothetical protein